MLILKLDEKISAEQFGEALEATGITSGDRIMIHSEILKLGLPVGGMQLYLDGILTRIGSNGTLVVPAFFNQFPKTKQFDPEIHDSKEFGAFSEYVRKQPNAVRGWHPFCSLAVLGQLQSELTLNDNPSVIGPDSTYQFMIESDFKILFLGKDDLGASVLHCAELANDVPYRKWMDFDGEIKIAGKWISKTARMHVRDQDINAVLDFKQIRQWVLDSGYLKSTQVNGGVIAAIGMRDYVAIMDAKLKSDVWALVGNAEEAKYRYANLKQP